MLSLMHSRNDNGIEEPHTPTPLSGEFGILLDIPQSSIDAI
jgi:hypothetical protein